MALRPPPRAPPYADFDELFEELSTQFHVTMQLSESARAEWTESDLRTWFASGGMIEPPSDPKLRAAAQDFNSKTDLRSQTERVDDERVQKTREAAMKAPWWEKVSDIDREKAQLYRDAALAKGIPPRLHGLIPADDPWLRELEKNKHMYPFEKHILFWDNESSPAKDGATRVALHADEGFTHGDSACVGRGLDMRYFWDSATLKLKAAVRYSLAAVGGWSALDDVGSTRWPSRLVHGGLLEAVMDELTAEVMKINISPETVTSEMTVQLKKPSLPGVTYKAEAEIVEVSPPLVVLVGKLTTMDGELVISARARCAMLDKLPMPPPALSTITGGVKDGGLTEAEANAHSIKHRVGLLEEIPEGAVSLGGEAHVPTELISSAASDLSAASAHSSAVFVAPPTDPVEATLQALQGLQAKLVLLLQEEYFCDDLEPPAEAFGWTEARIRSFFESGGND